MDILRVPSLWIGDTCYRRTGPVGSENGCNVNVTTGDTLDEFGDDFLDGGADYEDDLQHCPDVDYVHETGRYQMKFHVPSAFFSRLIGRKGVTKKRIEAETDAKVLIPRQEGDVIITGDSRKSVCLAWSRIHVMVESARVREDFTHFISVPMNAEEMKKAFAQFKDDLIQECGNERGVDKSVFQEEGMLHLTVGTMPLMDEHEREKAVALLEKCKSDVVERVLGRESLVVEVAGLEIMNDDPSEVDVVYAKVSPLDGSSKLQSLCDSLVEKFCSEGLMIKQYERVKLHVTLMNTLFRTEESIQGNVGNLAKVRKTLDARKILDKFGDRTFCQIAIKEIHLSQRRAGRRTADNYYRPSAVIKI